MLNRPVTTISARKRGTTRFLIGSTPSTISASSPSRILRAPRSAVIAVPATPAITIAQTSGANSRTTASTKRPPRRSIAPNRFRKFAAWIPEAPYVNATDAMIIGNQQSRIANRNRRGHGRVQDVVLFVEAPGAAAVVEREARPERRVASLRVQVPALAAAL